MNIQIRVTEEQRNDIPNSKDQIVSIKQIGPKMRDLLNKIRSIYFHNSDAELEILIHDKIIVNMDIPLELIYRQIHLRSNSLNKNKMEAILRIKGLREVR